VIGDRGQKKGRGKSEKWKVGGNGGERESEKGEEEDSCHTALQCTKRLIPV
jgi:hypothetical protein